MPISLKERAREKALTYLRVFLEPKDTLDIFIRGTNKTQTKIVVNTTIASSSGVWLGSYIATLLDLKYCQKPKGILLELGQGEGMENRLKAMVDDLSAAIFEKDHCPLNFYVHLEDRTKAQVNWRESLSFHLKMYHSDLTIDDIEPAGSPGYWRIKKPCGGKGICLSPLHGCLFNEGPAHHTIYYADPIRINGRFASPYRTWYAHKKEVELINANA